MKKRLFIVTIILFSLLFENANYINAKAPNKTDETNKQTKIIKPNKPNESKEDSKLSEEADKTMAKSELQNLYNIRSSIFTSLDLKKLPELFDTSQKYGSWALDHEVKRIKYLNEWSYRRNIKFTDVSSTINFKRVKRIGNRYRFSLTEIYTFNYMYKDDPDPINNCFKVGIRHGVDLINKNNKWLIYNDWYTDCFEDALDNYTNDLTMPNTSKLQVFSIPNNPRNMPQMLAGQYDRMAAIEYADKYYLNYNKKYMDFTGIGGDCTNFVSQCLSDKEGGNLKYGGGWHCSGGHGSRAFVNTDAFRDYLIYSGRGRLIKVGKFPDLVKSTTAYPNGAVGKLIAGDIVAYAKKNNIDHFAIVTDFDSHGYPLINSHTTDRYHVPWDLGWANSNINFHIIHSSLH